MKNRLRYAEGTIPRVRGVFPIGHYQYGGLYTIKPGEGVCGISNSGGRSNACGSGGLAPDKVGKENRELVYDACVTNDNGGFIQLPQTRIF